MSITKPLAPDLCPRCFKAPRESTHACVADIYRAPGTASTVAPPSELLPCPCCGGTAGFDHDDDGWNWIECVQCGLSTNRRVSLMDDCRPLLTEAWNRRAALPAATDKDSLTVQVAPVATQIQGQEVELISRVIVERVCLHFRDEHRLAFWTAMRDWNCRSTGPVDADVQYTVLERNLPEQPSIKAVPPAVLEGMKEARAGREGDAARLDFMAEKPVRFIEESQGMYRVYRDVAAASEPGHQWRAFTSNFYETPRAAIDAASKEPT